MTSRREFLHLGAAALVVPASARLGLPIVPSYWSAQTAPMSFYKVVFDARFSACRDFADAAQHLGLPIQAIRGDVTDLWFDDLYTCWKKGPAAIAGMTQKGALFCLNLLAADQRMRLMYLGEHARQADGHVDHVFAGPPEVLRRAATMGKGYPDWSDRVANLMSRFPANAAEVTPLIVAPLAGHVDAPEHLVSWVIAPRRTA